MSICTSCGSQDIFKEKEMLCLHTENYTDADNKLHKDILAFSEWHIALCRACAAKRLGEKLRRLRAEGIYFGPFLVVGGLLVTGALLQADRGQPFIINFRK